jgi:hypothetical protein
MDLRRTSVAYFRTRRPPLLAIWGKNDPFFLPAGAEAYRRDNPSAEVHLLGTPAGFGGSVSGSRKTSRQGPATTQALASTTSLSRSVGRICLAPSAATCLHRAHRLVHARAERAQRQERHRSCGLHDHVVVPDHAVTVLEQRRDLLEGKAQLLQRQDAVQARQLADAVVALAALGIRACRAQQAELVVVPEQPARNLRDLGELTDPEHRHLTLVAPARGILPV